MSVGRSLARYGLYALLASWFGLTVAQQFKKRPAILNAVDPANTTLPISTFFAPNPGTTDTHLLVRDKLADGTLTPWAEYPLARPRKPLHMIWHPVRRGEKALFDIAAQLTTVLRQEQRVEHVQLTNAYLSLLNFVTHCCEHAPDARQVQFLLVSSAGNDAEEEPRTLLTSDFHDLATETAA